MFYVHSGVFSINRCVGVCASEKSIRDDLLSFSLRKIRTGSALLLILKGTALSRSSETGALVHMESQSHLPLFLSVFYQEFPVSQLFAGFRASR